MNNWRLLLFAVLCIFQPISSEENLFNGRERCLQQRSDFSRKDTRISAYEYIATPSTGIRRINTRKEIRTIPEQRDTEQDSSRRQLTSQREGLSQNLRQGDQGIRTNDRVGLVSRQTYDADRVSRRSLSRNDRTEPQIRNIRNERLTDADNLLKNRRITPRQETNARSFRSQAINDNDRRTYEREVTRARNLYSRNSESPNIPTSRNVVQREYDNVRRRPAQNIRLMRNVNKISQKTEFVQIGEDESRNLKSKLTNRVNINDRMNLEASRRSEQLVPENLRDVRQNEGTDVRAQAIRTNSVNTDSRRSADVNDNRRNYIQRSVTNFRRQDTERKVQKDFRLELETRVRRDVDTDRRNNIPIISSIGEQIRQNKAARDPTVRTVRRERRPSLRTNIGDSRMKNRDPELNRGLAIRSSRRLSLERENKITREFLSRSILTENADFNRIANERIRLVSIKQTDGNHDDQDRRESNVLRRQRSLEGIRNIKQDNYQREYLENSQRCVNRDENRMVNNRFRQNMERDNGQRYRSIEGIRINRDDEMRENSRIRRSIPLSDRFANKINRDESTRLSRINEFSTESRDLASETFFTFELQHLFYIIQAIYLINMFRKIPQNKVGYEKKSWFGSWKTPIVMKMD